MEIDQPEEIGELLPDETRFKMLLGQQIDEVRDLRLKVGAEKAILEESREAWIAQNTKQMEFIEQLMEELRLAEDSLRDTTIEAFRTTGSKKPALGVGIREVQKVQYERGEALAWAKEHGVCLDLDGKAFEALAKSCHGYDMPCRVESIVQATIARFNAKQ